jgi:hypothetical protein
MSRMHLLKKSQHIEHAVLTFVSMTMNGKTLNANIRLLKSAPPTII